jgi:hypothetical protein
MFWPWKDLLIHQSCWVGSSRKEVVKKSSNDLQYFFILFFMLFSLVRLNLDQCSFMSLSILMKWIQPSSLQYWNQKSNHYCYAHLQYLWRMYDPIYKAFVFCFCILWSYVFIIVILELYPSSYWLALAPLYLQYKYFWFPFKSLFSFRLSFFPNLWSWLLVYNGPFKNLFCLLRKRRRGWTIDILLSVYVCEIRLWLLNANVSFALQSVLLLVPYYLLKCFFWGLFYHFLFFILSFTFVCSVCLFCFIP